MKKTTSVFSILIYAVLLMAIIGALAFVFAYMDNGNKNYYVQYGSKKISSKAENLELRQDALNVFYCKKVLGVTSKQTSVSATDYTVSISPIKTAVADFYFTVGDERRERFYGDIDYAKGFDISKQDGWFFIYYPADYTMQDYLQKIYGESVKGEDIDLSDMVFNEKDCFSLSVKYVSDDTTVTIDFH